MGVQARVVVYARDATEAESASAAAFARLDALEQVMSDYRPDSELMRLCSSAGQGPVPISDDLYTILDRALDAARRTDGAFDPTLGPVTALWRESRQAGALPAPAALDDARARTGWRDIILDDGARTARLVRPGMRLDLGGIGKCYAVHEAVNVLRARGTPCGMVALAGDIALGDPPPESEQRTANSEQPDSAQTSGLTGHGALSRQSSVVSPGRGWIVSIAGTCESILLSNTCISTSGDTEQFVEIEGVRYSHIIDAATGRGLTRRVRATVIDPDGATADALATALCVARIDDAPTLLARFPTAAAWMVEATDDGPRQFRSPGFLVGRPGPGGSVPGPALPPRE